MRQTKNDMARIITQAMYNMPDLPPADHHRVKLEAKAPKARVTERYELAHKILTDRVRRRLAC